MPALFEACARIDGHPQLHRLYGEYLFLLHTMARAIVPLMEEAVARLRTALPEDPLSEPLIAYLERHIVEEVGHDVWVLEDFEALGGRREDILTRIPPPAVAQAVGAQYYWIRHHNPVALLGYIAALEGYPPPVEAVDDLCTRSGLPPAAFRVLREHAVVDSEHRRDFDLLLERLPLTDGQLTLICVSAVATVRSVVRAVDDLLNEFEELVVLESSFP